MPIGFDWPLNKPWQGYLQPERFEEDQCPTCSGGCYAPYAQKLNDQWYGNAPFDPASTGSTLLTADTPAVRHAAEQIVNSSPGWYQEFHGCRWVEQAIHRHAAYVAVLWNRTWSRHLSQDDVDALFAQGRLLWLTHTWSKDNGWAPNEPAHHPTATEVNEWAMTPPGHPLDKVVVIQARCERAGQPFWCTTCQGHGTLELYPGQRAAAEAWEQEDHGPPVGEGWQVWENVTEGSPISPVFNDSETLVQWLISPENTSMGGLNRSQAEAFVKTASQKNQ
ncbi:hypothetical protein [Mycobacteroides abscessus]|uniref:hypothetical protein n=1 Tax=Mycobacteroides abscessus TaxID=36809 RepID=UPI001041F259|nr:hypothetical protein [Mycobacteroides abscessus]